MRRQSADGTGNSSHRASLFYCFIRTTSHTQHLLMTSSVHLLRLRLNRSGGAHNLSGFITKDEAKKTMRLWALPLASLEAGGNSLQAIPDSSKYTAVLLSSPISRGQRPNLCLPHPPSLRAYLYGLAARGLSLGLSVVPAAL